MTGVITSGATYTNSPYSPSKIEPPFAPEKPKPKNIPTVIPQNTTRLNLDTAGTALMCAGGAPFALAGLILFTPIPVGAFLMGFSFENAWAIAGIAGAIFGAILCMVTVPVTLTAVFVPLFVSPIGWGILLGAITTFAIGFLLKCIAARLPEKEPERQQIPLDAKKV